MDWLWTTIGVVVLALCLISRRRNTKKLPLPPGPAGFPILGSLPSLGKNPHHDLHRLSRQYGPIMYLQLGLVPTVVVSSPEYAEKFLKMHDLVFASRPPHEGSRIVSYGQRNLSFAPYGPYWRFIRKKCTLELLSPSKTNSFKPMRREEIGLLIEYLKKAAADGAAVDLSERVSSTGVDMSCWMVFGRKYLDDEFDERGFGAVIQETMQLAAAPNIGEFIPYLRRFDLQGLVKKLKEVAAVFDAFFEKIIDDHVVARTEGRESRDFTDAMLGIMEEQDEAEFRIDRRHIKAVMLDMLVASMDTSAVTVDWAMAELVRNPNAMKKLQRELESIVGLDRLVEESDLEGLNYLDMVVKETFRLHPVAPLLLPHESTEECVIDDRYRIPAKSRLIVNVWSIGRDPSVWSDPEKFVPERFEGSSIDVRGRDFQLLPFGAGRRGCPGLQLGLTLVRLMVAQLVHCFDWELPDGARPSDLDMREEFGITVPRAQHLVVVPSYRLRM